MAHAQKPDFVFRRNGRVHLNQQEASVHSTTGSRGVRISGSNAGYTMFGGSVKSTGYPLQSAVSPSLPRRASSCAITFQLDSTRNRLGAGPLPCGCAHFAQNTDDHLPDYTVSNARLPQYTVHVQKHKGGCDRDAVFNCRQGHLVMSSHYGDQYQNCNSAILATVLHKIAL